MPKKTLVVVAGILIVLAGGALAYKEWPGRQVQQSDHNQQSIQDETADWQFYRNERYGFEFRYPPDWGIDVSENDPKSEYVKT